MKINRSDRHYKAAGPGKHFDGGGLFLLVNAKGKKHWRLAYRFQGKPSELSFGPYPAVGLGLARERRDEAKALLAKGINPSQQRRETRATVASVLTFGEVCNEWFAKFQVGKVRPGTLRRNRGLLNFITGTSERPGLPIAKRDIGLIEANELRDVLTIQEDLGHMENVSRLRGMIESICRYAVGCGYRKYNPASALIDAFAAPVVKHMAAITEPYEAGVLFRDIASYEQPLTRAAMQFLALTATRPGEQRRAEWNEIDFEKRVWVIPASKMKKNIAHDVPLSRQAIAILESLKQITGSYRYVFATGDKPMSDNTVNKALRSLGYNTQTEHCAHGFRSLFSTLVNSEYIDRAKRWDKDVIEKCLAHNDGDGTRAAYNRGLCVKQRTELMQEWADRVDMLRDGAKILPLAKMQAEKATG